MDPDAIFGAVLAGGRSRRMGRDKAMVPYAGRPLVRHAVEILGAVIPEVTVISSNRSDYRFLPVPVLEDLYPDRGPLGGLHAALVHAAGRPVFCLACDLPLVGGDLVRHIIDPSGALFSLRKKSDTPHPALPEELARVPTLAGRTQPLCGWYAPACREPIERRLAAGKWKVLDFLKEIPARWISLTPELPFYRDDLLININREEDYQKVIARMDNEDRFPPSFN